MKTVLVLFLSCFAFVLEAQASFLPEKDLANAVAAKGISSIDEKEFQGVISRIQAAYAPFVKEKGGQLSVSGDWKSEKLNAAASQIGSSWRVVITGALARRPELTKDGFTLILCHELGHHLGGFPFAADGNPFQKPWAANEGQADYFSTQVCARKLWAAETETNAGYRAEVSDFVRQRCDTAWAEEAGQDLCYRVSAAVKSVTDTMGGILGKPAPNFETPDPAVVAKTSDAHPATQCRMDTLFQAGICTQDFGDKIPGKTAPGGVHGIEAEKESAARSCTSYSGHVFGKRPLCWFKPRL